MGPNQLYLRYRNLILLLFNYKMRQDSKTKFVIKHFAIQKMDADDFNNQ